MYSQKYVQSVPLLLCSAAARRLWVSTPPPLPNHQCLTVSVPLLVEDGGGGNEGSDATVDRPGIGDGVTVRWSGEPERRPGHSSLALDNDTAAMSLRYVEYCLLSVTVF